jgi:hypothetical protein
VFCNNRVSGSVTVIPFGGIVKTFFIGVECGFSGPRTGDFEIKDKKSRPAPGGLF